MKKRTAWYLVLVIALVALVGVACGSSEDPTATPRPAATAAPVATSTPAPTGPERGGILRMALDPGAASLDPAVITTGMQYIATRNAYNNLTLLDPDFVVQPDLAESWDINGDASEFTFRLRKGATFHQGKNVTAQDVVFTFERLLNPDVASPARSSLGFITDVVAVDDGTVRFTLEKGNSFFLNSLSLHQGRIIPSNVDTTRLATQEFGSGPFIITDNAPGERIVFERYEDYWDEGLPYLDGLIFLPMAETETRIQALLTDAVDIAFAVPGSALSRIEGSTGATVSEGIGASYFAIAMDLREPPFDNKLVRKAMQHAIDREAVQKAALLGRGAIGNDHPIPPTSPYYWEDQQITPYDTDRAKELLTEAGYPDGLDLTLFTTPKRPGEVDTAVTYKETAAPAGIRIQVENRPADTYNSKVWMKNPFFMSFWGHRNADQALSVIYLQEAPWNEARYKNPRLDQLIVEMRAQGDLAGRKQTLSEIQRILIDDVPRIIPVFVPTFLGLRDNVRGVRAHPATRMNFTWSWLEK